MRGRSLILVLIVGGTPAVLGYSGMLDHVPRGLVQGMLWGAMIFCVAMIPLALRDHRRDGMPLTIVTALLGVTGGLFYAALLSLAGTPLGRPFRRRGGPMTAGVRPGRGWAGDLVLGVDGVDPGTREELAAAWLCDAQAEHASIAAFAQLALDLLALGAPAALLEGATAAQADEIRHARACFAMASAYAGKQLTPAAWPEAARAAASAPSWRRLAVDSLRDGCLGEQTSADVARAGAGLAADPAVQALLEELADDEARHAELAWAIVAHCLAVEPGLAGALRAEADAAAADAPHATAPTPGPLAAHGRLSPSAAADLRAACARRVAERLPSPRPPRPAQ